ncbi:hypothetical protein ABTM19_19895, partial [Acinetobacter baumannii]
IALLAAYVMAGASQLSLDCLFSQGLKSSPLPQSAQLIAALDTTRPVLSDVYLLVLRLALGATLLLAGGHILADIVPPFGGVTSWLPVNSA